MADFGDNFDDPEVDPAAEFLAREQDQLAGLEDELKPAAPPLINGSSVSPVEGSGSFEMINTLGQGDAGFDPLNGGNDFANDSLISADPTLDFFSEPAASEENSSLPLDDETESTPQSTPSKPVIREEPEKIRKWREEQKKLLEDKDAQEEKKKAEMREVAKRELEEWYKHHSELIAKTKADNRNAEKQFVAEADAIEPGTEWERIAKLCDFNPKSARASKDTSRMRSIILQLKQSPLPISVKH